jgi:hypothetical protein
VRGYIPNFSQLPPQTGKRAGVRRKDKIRNSYTIKLKKLVKGLEIW